MAGPGLAAHAFRAELVDECRLFLVPILVGGGKQALPHEVRLGLELLDERRFRSGMVYLRYAARVRSRRASGAPPSSRARRAVRAFAGLRRG